MQRRVVTFTVEFIESFGRGKSGDDLIISTHILTKYQRAREELMLSIEDAFATPLMPSGLRLWPMR